MQFADVLCYVFLTITVTASCVGADKQEKEIEQPQLERKVRKREATVLMDNYPMDRIFQKPKVIYRRISKQRYGPPKPKYGGPKPKYGHLKPTRKPIKKVPKGKPSSPNYGLSNPSKKRANKPKHRYGPSKSRPSFGHVVKMPHYSFFIPDETGFGEPPVQFGNNYQHQEQNYGEPPVDSYGAPLNSNIRDVYPTAQSYQETTSYYDGHDFNRQELESYQIWNHKYNQNLDSNFALSKQQYSMSDNLIFVTPEPKNHNEETPDSNIPDKQVMQENKFFFRKKRPQYFTDNAKTVNRPWRPNKHVDFENKIVVGGQYAEPPARIVPKFEPNAPNTYDDDDETVFSHGFIDSEIASSATNSPYSNYKNSNMAFSPQNLNDAFSIVDK